MCQQQARQNQSTVPTVVETNQPIESHGHSGAGQARRQAQAESTDQQNATDLLAESLQRRMEGRCHEWAGARDCGIFVIKPV